MENLRPDTDAQLVSACATQFEQLPPEMIVSAFGVDYGHVRPREGGDLYLTRWGWPRLAQLLPSNWYTDSFYAREGRQLTGTGSVYYVRTKPAGGKSLEIVVKFSRVAQYVPLEVATTFPDDIDPEIIANARFNSPMEEFALLMELRRGAYGPRDLHIITQWPLAIYAPPEEFELWQLGRSQTQFDAHWRRLASDQESAIKAIEFDIKRIYVLLYAWIKGEDATQALEAGYITAGDFNHLTPRVVAELRSKGFRVLDNKPSHFILRRNSANGAALRRGGQLVYGLVDFELLQRTPEYQSRFKAEQRRIYWKLQSQRFEPAPAPAPHVSHLKPMNVFGVDYVFGATPDGGRLWVVGRNAALFDYFVPGRWRRTSRLKLSGIDEIYYTRTRDNIHLVYRRSRVGTQPHADPLFEQGRRIREHGRNSPFEEVAIAEWLRRGGILTTFPRAIYRTGHETTRSKHARDERRFISHAHLVIPGSEREPVLHRDYDYYTIWGYFRGVIPDGTGRLSKGVLDLESAVDSGLLDPEDCDSVLRNSRTQLQSIGLEVGRIQDYEFALAYDEEGALRRDERGDPEVRLCIDALTAYEHGLLNEERYRELVLQMEERLKAVGCEELDLRGDHLLLSMDPSGAFMKDEHGEMVALLCNFEFIRGPTELLGSPSGGVA